MGNDKTQANKSIDIILLLGLTGVAKSTFINAAGSRGKLAIVGRSLQSCTTKPEGYLVVLNNKQRVILVDTPGFDNTDADLNDDYILQIIIAWLQDALRYDENARLAGIIYLHSVHRRGPSLGYVNDLRIPPSVVLVNVLCQDDPNSDRRRETIRERYPDIFNEDHLGNQNQQATALALIDKVIESRAPAPLSSVIEKLQRLRDTIRVNTAMQEQWKDAYPGITGTLLNWAMLAFGRDVKQGSYSALWALTSDKIVKENMNGWYFSNPDTPGKESAQASDPALGAALFELSERIVREKLGPDALIDWCSEDAMQGEGEAKAKSTQRISHSKPETQKQQHKGKMEIPAVVDAKNVKPAHDHGMSFAGAVKN